MRKLSLLYILIFSLALGSILTGCENRADEKGQPEIAVTNSYLQCVVKDLCGDNTDILCLAPPGMCPGHFDISPTQVKQLCNCRILLLFDFQKRVEDSLSRMKSKGLKTGLVKAPPGLCVPETYLAACREVCGILSSEYPERQAQYKQRLELIGKRLDNLSEELLTKTRQSGLESAKVLASNHQSDFANWLGLETVATFVGSDIETFSNINNCLEKAKGQDVRFVIANKQEGTALAEALADRLGADAIVFSNFPDTNPVRSKTPTSNGANSGQSGFDQMLRENVRTLLKAVEQ